MPRTPTSRAAAPQGVDRRRRILAPPALLGGVCLGFGVLADHLAPARIFPPASTASMWLSLVIFAVGGGLLLWSLRAFRVHRTTVSPYGRPEALVTGGAYRLSRNPLYLALVVLLVAFGVALDSWWTVASAVILWALLDLGVVRVEERILVRRFGNAYRDYAGRVRRWL